MRQLILFTLLLSSSLWASDNKLYLSTHYYDGLGQKFRVEKVVKYDQDCQETRMAEVIVLDKTNEIRELAILDGNGQWKGFPKTNISVLKEITHLIKRASSEKNPCLSNADQKRKEKEEQEQKNLDELQEMPAPPAPVPQKPKAKEVLE